MQIRMRRSWIALAIALVMALSGVAGSQLAAGASAASNTSAAHAAKAAKKKKHKAKKQHKKHKAKKHKAKKHKKHKPPKKPPKKTEAQELGVGPVEKGATKAIESASEIPTAPAWTEEQLNKEPSGNWISSMGGTTGDHFSHEKEITTSNVTSLKAAWMTQLDGSGEGAKYSAEGTPVEYDGVIYYATGADDVFAVSVASGKILWVHKAELPETVQDVCCGWDNRGVALGDGMVFTSVIDGYYEALNQKTGELVWKTEIDEPSEGLTADEQPTYYNGMLFGGTVGSDYAARGYMTAMNAKTGQLIWKHYDVPGPGEYGANTWPRNSPCSQCNKEWLRGGAGSWNGPTVDDKTGLIYYSTANASPTDQGVTREGDDLWAVSILALNYKTGELAWGYQMVHHDIWDYDAATLPSMINVKINGKDVEGIIHANKDGYVYFVNADTGQPVFPIEEKPVPQDFQYERTAPMQPIPSMPPMIPMKASQSEVEEIQKGLDESAAKAHEPAPKAVNGGYNEEDVFGAPWPATVKNTAEISSGGGSGSHQGVSTYDPTTGDYYTCSLKSESASTAALEFEKAPEAGQGFFGARGKVSGSSKQELGFITAYSLETGKMLWRDELPHRCYNGLLSTEGGLVFDPTWEGNLVAYNASTGAELWKFALGAAGSPAMAFEWNGKEYIVDYGGGNEFAGEKQGDNLWAFVLNGTGPGPIELGKTPPPPEKITE